MSKRDSQIIAVIQHGILEIRGEPVLLDSELARLFDVSTGHLNERVKRNADRFGPEYAFRLTGEEFEALRSQSAISKSGRGGRRYLPWVFTEYGVVMAATLVSSPKAIAASKLVVEVFVEVRRRLNSGTPLLPAGGAKGQTGQKGGALERVAQPGTQLSTKLQAMLERLMETVIDGENQSTVRDEINALVTESVRNLKARLKRAGLENDEIAARTTKLLAEAENQRAVAAKNRAEANALEFTTFVRKLQLLIEADKAIASQDTDAFLKVLAELGRAR